MWYTSSGVTMVSGPRGFLLGGPRGASLVARSAAERAPSAGVWGAAPRGFQGQGKFGGKFGGLEAILAIRNIQIDMKLKVTKSNNIMNKCHNE